MKSCKNTLHRISLIRILSNRFYVFVAMFSKILLCANLGFGVLFFSACSSAFVDIARTNFENLPKKQLQNEASVTLLGSLYRSHVQNGETGGILLTNGEDSFLHRMALVRMAQKSILVQSYIYRDDPSSRVLIHELYKAAQRGVKVKILIDDNGLDSDFSDIIAIDSHPNIEVRIFNPYRNRNRKMRFLEMAFDYHRINRRMHNKIFIVDDSVFIIGGRNIADDYFDFDKYKNFTDIDAVFFGGIVLDAKENFMDYWENKSSIEAIKLPSRRKLKKYNRKKKSIAITHDFGKYEYKKLEEELDKVILEYKNESNKIFFGKAQFIGDRADKIHSDNTSSAINDNLENLLKSATQDIYIAHSYFVPTKSISTLLTSLRDEGVKISILTNSLSSTDVVVIHSGWEKYRKNYLETGMNIYEYQYDGKKVLRSRIKNMPSSLHMKAIVIDRKVTLIGSFNIDQRSISSNTENVVIFYNPHFAQNVVEDIEDELKNTWRVMRVQNKIYWCGYNKDGIYEIHKKNPNTHWLLRMANLFFKILPEKEL